MKTKAITAVALGACCALVLAGNAQAGPNDDYVQADIIKEAKKAKVKQGWGGAIRIGANASLGHSSTVVGKPNGLTFGFGADISGNINYRMRGHEWRNSLTLTEMFSKTPTIDGVVKTADKWWLESIYLYHFERFPWIGPFARVALETSLFPGHDYQAEDFTYKVTALDGSATTSMDNTFRVSDAFAPTIFKESVGAFTQPFSKTWFNLEFRLGIGGRQVLADEQYVVGTVDKDKKTIDIKETESYAEAGGEAVLAIWGQHYDGKVAYKLGAEVLVPFANSADTGDKTVGDLTSLEFSARLSFKLVDWASLEYEFSAKRLPQLQEDWQVQNNLFLSIAYARLFGTQKKDKAKADAKK